LTSKKRQSIESPKKNESFTLNRLLERSAESFGEKTAIIYNEKNLSYSELHSLSNQFANILLSSGLIKGDRVALFLPNSSAYVIAFFGALKAGGVVTAINPLHREREVEFQLRDSGAKAIVTLDSLEPLVAKFKGNTPLEHIIMVAPDDASLNGLTKEVSSHKLDASITAGDLAALQYTGGTTGAPKAAMLTHGNLAANAQQFAQAIKGTASDIFLTALPLFHIYGLTTSLTTPISLGAKMVLMPRFQPALALEAIQQHKVTVFCGVPTMYQQLLASPDLAKYDLHSIRVCISGAAPLPPQVQKRFMEVTGGVLAEGYGLTEASPVTHCSPVERRLVRVGSVGLPLAGTEVRIVDAETGTRTLPIGETGELAVKGQQVMAGYWNRAEETKSVLRDGWLLTGDIARINADGYLILVDRKKDLIKHNGYSIYPRELEDILYEHPAVRQCAVVGKADAEAGENPVAYVVLKDGAEATAEAIEEFVNSKVAAYKAVHKVIFMQEIPINGAGKVLKRVLRERA
jgi:long-chain acyl-CoA synthetase